MKKFLKITLIVGAGCIVYAYSGQISVRLKRTVSELQALVSPCGTPIAYTIGSFDTRFGISQKNFLAALAEAEAIWESSTSRNLFEYRADGSLPINLVYDYRQEATAKLAKLGVDVSNSRASYDGLIAKHAQLLFAYRSEKVSYESRLAEFEKKKVVYEEQIRYWNERGGAPEEEYVRLQVQKTELQNEVVTLNAQQLSLNEQVVNLNSLVLAINRLVDSLNLSVSKYNTIGASRGESFEEGVYVRDGSGEKIDIYEFENQDKLVRVLAHELGHALGLEHVEDPSAIMYKLNTGDSKILSGTDKAAVVARCGPVNK